MKLLFAEDEVSMAAVSYTHLKTDEKSTIIDLRRINSCGNVRLLQND